MADCKSCNGGCCESCGGCKGDILLSEGEIALLQALGQFSFLPVARKAGDMTPVYREETDYTEEEYSLFITIYTILEIFPYSFPTEPSAVLPPWTARER